MSKKIGPCQTLTLGVSSLCENDQKGIQAAFALKQSTEPAQECGILFYDKTSGLLTAKHIFPRKNQTGLVRYGQIKEIETDNTAYLFFEGDNFIRDKYASSYLVKGSYGEIKSSDDFKGIFISHEYDWEDTVRPDTPFEDSVIYGLHVRGFTMHESSHVRARGTFAGIVEKLPYLKELGITAIELQPCYEFDEMECINHLPDKKYRLNYWGYTEGYYYASKSAYAYSDDAVREFKDMVKACHRQNIEVFMQFHFPETVVTDQIQDILRYWAHFYQIDGFHFMGIRVPVESFLSDPYLTDVKLINDDFAIRPGSGSGCPRFQKLAVYDDSFMHIGRKFLKGDAGVIKDIMYMLRRNPVYTGRVDYFADHAGFTLMDMVSYNEKHNENNGEKGRDGTEYNYSWNCGEEGETKFGHIRNLRTKQLKNAFTMLLLAQSTPYIFMGDEFGNSQGGNNNPYCLDNETTWLNWQDQEHHSELLEFVKMLIALRMNRKIFHLNRECTMKDDLCCGYPDLSYHNEQAWMPMLEKDTRNIGFMLCGEYAKGCEGSFWYVAMNMHWEAHRFVLPDLKNEMKWEKYFSTEAPEISQMEDSINREAYSEAEHQTCFDKKEILKGRHIMVAPRSISVYIGKK